MTWGLDDAMEEPREAPVRRRRWVTVVLALFVLALLGLCVLRLGGFDLNRYTTAAIALTPYLAAAGLLLAFLSLALRRRLLTFTALVLAIAFGFLLIPRYLADGEPLPTGQRVRVMTANLLMGKADAPTVIRLARDAKVDVLVLQELTPQALNALDAAGLPGLLPHRVAQPAGGTSGTAILAKVPLRQIVLVQGSFHDQPAAVVDLSGNTDVEIVSVHAYPPVLNEEGRRRWQADLEALPSSDSKGRPRILAGDFNATLDHKALHGVMDRGYWDSAEVVGEGMRPTWSQFPYGPPVAIDHVLVDRRLGVAEVKVYDLPGSDHNAVVAEVALPR
ncbi:Metal-dependent hydrolase, endonuclease/exonuclease/phosphatase family [Actinokineospora alba]|uniref:Metal-dependent hydrolase, endonuclease/exonuclease/phosphatase family n=1 Tax=Actinokineospora alba TaxID=504798 RepID=A0A1H0SUD2_9PSEU|nr:endonuclease/exonuclease/phosphatase family protein [Actinokineospora alba]TDP66531.1 endonuclease/exonuclease/phosphatase family metal-dependent hydrolase [Actinokineospora alba]SDJ37111.1 Metal-dependent hydrolase, endonuclease/exonuclease/phosphatase family [Actinokineospora alba]SDP45351.1 Metal-dependent hydrolase, endonuclease/exonuclease/phosphatase family [Actinokineospora alba]